MNEKTKAQRTLRTAQKMRQKKDDNVDDDDVDDDEEEEEEVRQTSQTERLAALPIELNLNPNLKSKPKLNLGIKYLMNVLLVLGLCLSLSWFALLAVYFSKVLLVFVPCPGTAFVVASLSHTIPISFFLSVSLSHSLHCYLK